MRVALGIKENYVRRAVQLFYRRQQRRCLPEAQQPRNVGKPERDSSPDAFNFAQLEPADPPRLISPPVDFVEDNAGDGTPGQRIEGHIRSRRALDLAEGVLQQYPPTKALLDGARLRRGHIPIVVVPRFHVSVSPRSPEYARPAFRLAAHPGGV